MRITFNNSDLPVSWDHRSAVTGTIALDPAGVTEERRQEKGRGGKGGEERRGEERRGEEICIMLVYEQERQEKD